MPEGKLRELPNRDGTLKLGSGRALGFRVHGDPRGAPVFYFHGFPGSRIEAGFVPVTGLALVAVERPGYGLSDPHRRRQLKDWPEDIAALADHLGFERFSVLGVSGGAPYAAACAWAMPGRVKNAALVCGIGPPEAPGMDDGRMPDLLKFGRRGPIMTPLVALARRLLLDPKAEPRVLAMRERYLAQRYGNVPKERAVISADFLSHMLANWREALKHSLGGIFSDARIYGEPWGFPLSQIRAPVHLWHGEEDRVVPVAVGQHYAAHIPGVRARILPGEGHFSVIFNSLPEIVDALLAPS